MKDPKHLKFQNYALPDWFFDIYDAIDQGKPIDNSPNIKAQPLYLRYRYRIVKQLIRETNLHLADKSKAMVVFDLSNFR